LLPVIPLALLLAAQAMAQGQEEMPEPARPEWCNCECVAAAESEEERTRLLNQIRVNQSLCWKELGVAPDQARKGQGARMDACACDCLNEGAEPAEGPWGDKKKPAKQGQGQGQQNGTPEGQ
jgi:hypothetical protein